MSDELVAPEQEELAAALRGVSPGGAGFADASEALKAARLGE